MGTYGTPQEAFWAGEFGNEYIERNSGEVLKASYLAFWAQVVRRMPGMGTALELGANIGLNLRALAALTPEIDLTGVEINAKAVDALRKWGGAEVLAGSILDFKPEKTWDLTFTRGVLIHLSPNALPFAYDALYAASSRYILIDEYYNPTPVEVMYRGHEGKLFKRDFAGEMLDRFPGLRLLDYGFIYHRDPFPHDDSTWFLMEK